MTEEEEKHSGEVNPDALEAVFEEEVTLEEEVFVLEEEDENGGVDIAFQANDEGYW
jgi:hypothetical protein